MATVGKRVRNNRGLLEKDRVYPMTDGIGLLKQAASPKFDETVEIAVNLGIDPKKSDQSVRGAVSLPHGTGRTVRVIAFVKEELQDEAREAGAIEAGADELVKKVADGWTDFDVAVADPKLMGKVGKLGKVLGPQGKMPSPKAGTVTPDVAAAVKEYVAGKVEFRADAGGTVHAPIGKRSFDDRSLAENAHAFLAALNAQRPAAGRGQYVRKVFLTTTMGPAVMVDPAS